MFLHTWEPALCHVLPWRIFPEIFIAGLIQAWQVCHLKESCFLGFSVVSGQWNEVCGRNTGEGLSTASPKGCSSRSSQEKRELCLNLAGRWALSTVVAPIPDGILNVCCTTWSNVSVWTASWSCFQARLRHLVCGQLKLSCLWIWLMSPIWPQSPRPQVLFTHADQTWYKKIEIVYGHTTECSQSHPQREREASLS